MLLPRMLRRAAPFVVAVALSGGWLSPAAAQAQAALAEKPVQLPGEYLTRIAGCGGCHTAKDGVPFAGGRPLETPFGIFYSSNITPDRQAGIGGWSDDDFVRALHDGVGPGGKQYFPVFPFTSYTGMTREDVLAIRDYLRGVAPSRQAAPAHETGFPFAWRFLQRGWKALFFESVRFVPDPGRPAEWNRGAYLVNAVAHCGECHTPRNRFGARDPARHMAGTPDGPEGERVPNITPDPETGIGSWSEADMVQLLKTGFKPDYDVVGGSMGEAIQGLQHLTDADARAIAVYLKSLPPIHNKVVARGR